MQSSSPILSFASLELWWDKPVLQRKCPFDKILGKLSTSRFYKSRLQSFRWLILHQELVHIEIKWNQNSRLNSPFLTNQSASYYSTLHHLVLWTFLSTNSKVMPADQESKQQQHQQQQQSKVLTILHLTHGHCDDTDSMLCSKWRNAKWLMLMHQSTSGYWTGTPDYLSCPFADKWQQLHDSDGDGDDAFKRMQTLPSPITDVQDKRVCKRFSQNWGKFLLIFAKLVENWTLNFWK